MKVKITNAYNNRGTVDTTEIDIKNCMITNYDKDHSPSGAGDLTVDAGESNVIIKKGRSVFVNDNTINFNTDKYSIFKELAKQDKQADDITEEDLYNAHVNFDKKCKLAQLGVLSIYYEDGVAVLKIKNNQVLRFEFKKNSSGASMHGVAQEQIKTPNVGGINQTGTMAATELNHNAGSVNNTENLMDVFYTKIPKSYDKYIKIAAKKTGVSENFIKYLIYMEGDKSKAKLKAYRVNKDAPLVIGFGHTNNTDNAKNGNNAFDENTTITIETAFNYLIADINEHKKYCKHYLKDDFTKAPTSVQECLIDRSFLSGHNKFKKQEFKDKLHQGLYTDIITDDLWLNSNSRRTSYMFLLATSQMNIEEQSEAKNKFKTLGHYNKVVNNLVGAERENFIAAFDSIGF